MDKLVEALNKVLKTEQASDARPKRKVGDVANIALRQTKGFLGTHLVREKITVDLVLGDNKNVFVLPTPSGDCYKFVKESLEAAQHVGNLSVRNERMESVRAMIIKNKGKIRYEGQDLSLRFDNTILPAPILEACQGYTMDLITEEDNIKWEDLYSEGDKIGLVPWINVHSAGQIFAWKLRDYGWTWDMLFGDPVAAGANLLGSVGGLFIASSCNIIHNAVNLDKKHLRQKYCVCCDTITGVCKHSHGVFFQGVLAMRVANVRRDGIPLDKIKQAVLGKKLSFIPDRDHIQQACVEIFDSDSSDAGFYGVREMNEVIVTSNSGLNSWVTAWENAIKAAKVAAKNSLLDVSVPDDIDEVIKTMIKTLPSVPLAHANIHMGTESPELKDFDEYEDYKKRMQERHSLSNPPEDKELMDYIKPRVIESNEGSQEEEEEGEGEEEVEEDFSYSNDGELKGNDLAQYEALQTALKQVSSTVMKKLLKERK